MFTDVGFAFRNHSVADGGHRPRVGAVRTCRNNIIIRGTEIKRPQAQGPRWYASSKPAKATLCRYNIKQQQQQQHKAINFKPSPTDHGYAQY